jgi:RecG-like helicase
VTDVDKEPGRFRRALSRLTADELELESKELQDVSSSAGATHVAQCSVGAPVCVAGSLRAVVLRPRAGVPTLEAELYDGTGTVTLIWLGRRRIRGIDPGRNLVVRGRLTRQDGRPTIYNPAYELRASSA